MMVNFGIGGTQVYPILLPFKAICHRLMRCADQVASKIQALLGRTIDPGTCITQSHGLRTQSRFATANTSRFFAVLEYLPSENTLTVPNARDVRKIIIFLIGIPVCIASLAQANEEIDVYQFSPIVVEVKFQEDLCISLSKTSCESTAASNNIEGDGDLPSNDMHMLFPTTKTLETHKFIDNLSSVLDTGNRFVHRLEHEPLPAQQNHSTPIRSPEHLFVPSRILPSDDRSGYPDHRLTGETNSYSRFAPPAASESVELSHLNKLLLYLPSVPQYLVDFSAGWGDAVSFGLTRNAREFFGTSEVVNRDTKAYTSGILSGTANVSTFIGGTAVSALRAGRSGTTLIGSGKVLSLKLRLNTKSHFASLSLIKHTKKLGPSWRAGLLDVPKWTKRGRLASKLPHVNVPGSSVHLPWEPTWLVPSVAAMYSQKTN